MAAKRKSILGARPLGESDVDWINKILTMERAYLDLINEVVGMHRREQEAKTEAAKRLFRHHDINAEKHELDRFHAAEPFTWAARSKEHIQMGTMALVRSISQPSGK